jgi:hypothetical protein
LVIFRVFVQKILNPLKVEPFISIQINSAMPSLAPKQCGLLKNVALRCSLKTLKTYIFNELSLFYSALQSKQELSIKWHKS